ncbi:MAG: dTMP kinase [Cyanobacteria bacterium P01_D01_bin.73]
MQGRLITFEGIDGVGKTTQLQCVRSWLADAGWARSLVATREPGGTAIGRHLRSVLLQIDDETLDDRAELLLYAADRAQHLAEVIMPALEAGQWVLCDRFTDSTIAYQGFGRGLDMGLVEQSVEIATQGVKPDLTLWFDVDPTLAVARRQARSGKGDRLEAAGLEFQQRVREGFQALAKQCPERIVRLDARMDAKALFAAVKSVLEPRLKQWLPEDLVEAG